MTNRLLVEADTLGMPADTAWVDVALGTVVAGLGVLSLWSAPAYVAYDFRDADDGEVGP